MIQASILICICLCVLNCGVDTSSSGVTDYDARVVDDMNTEQRDIDGGPNEFNDTNEVNGVWAQRVILSGIAEVPVLGFQETNTVGLGKVELTQNDKLVNYRLEICETKIQRADDIVTTLIPEQFIQSIPIYYRTGFVDNLTVHFSRMAEINGVHLNDPMLEPLPTDINDERIFDQDEDGFPGVTVYVTGLISGQIHLVQRTITELSGQLEANQISGLVTWSNEETILDSDQDLLRMGAPITPNIDPSRSVFDLIRIDGESSCSDIIEMAPMLFDPDPLVLQQ